MIHITHRHSRRLGIVVLVALLAFARADRIGHAAQGDCSDAAKQALQRAAQVCGNTGRNQACLGNAVAAAAPKPGASVLFQLPGDTVNLADLASLKLSSYGADGTWGIALLRVQANLPDTAPGQNVTMILFGDTQITNAAPPGSAPMQAFYLRTGVGDSACQGVPHDGVLLQSPKGTQKVQLVANGVELAVGSTVYINALPVGDTESKQQKLKIATLQGSVTVSGNGKSVEVRAGKQTSVDVLELEDGSYEVEAEPEDVVDYDLEEIDDLPFEFMPDELTLDEIITEAESTGDDTGGEPTEEAPNGESDPGATEEPGGEGGEGSTEGN